MLKDLLERFKRVFTVKDWKLAAQDAISKKEFVVASLDELHRIEKADAEMGRDRMQQRQPTPMHSQTQGFGAPVQSFGDGRRGRTDNKSDMTLADLMNSIRRQQSVN